MVENGRIRPGCVYASNPYHRCTDYCLNKTAGGQVEKAKTKSHSDNRGGTREGERGKRISQANTKGDNREPGSFVLDLSKDVSKRTNGSLPKPPRELRNVPASSILSSEAQSQTSHVYTEKKMESKSDNSAYSLQSVSTSAHISKSDNPKYTPKEGSTSDASPTFNTKKYEPRRAASDIIRVPISDDTEEGTTVSPVGSNFSFSGVPHSFEDSDGEDIKSIASEYRVSVGQYHVKSSFSSILHSIFDKYGDIAATCKLESFSIRSYYLECVCYVIQELQSSLFSPMTKLKIKELLAILKDVESSEIKVAWLRGILDEVAKVVENGSQNPVLEEAKENCDRAMELTKKDLESQMEDLMRKEKELADVKARADETKARFSELELKSSQLNEFILSIQSKVDDFLSNSISDSLL